ncbi:MAG: serine/threonine-protein kinase [Phycisphaerales bacterium]
MRSAQPKAVSPNASAADASGKADLASMEDFELAEFIQDHGRDCVREGKPPTLDVYFDLVPGLRNRQDPLDAAIEVVLYALSGPGGIRTEVVEQLAQQYPDLRNEIIETVELCELAGGVARELPCPFGPMMASGQRRYILERLLGEGSSGQVYLAIDLQFRDENANPVPQADDNEGNEAERPNQPRSDQVAIKILPTLTQVLWGGDRAREEAIKNRSVRHHNVVNVIECGESEYGELFIVSEYVPGGDLQKWINAHSLRREPLDIPSVVEIVLETADGLNAAHERGIIHCDLKPGNILLNEDGGVRITDFGIAVRSHHGETGDVIHLGNQAFIAPERLVPDTAMPTVRSDVYSLGGILYYMLTGRLPNGERPDGATLTAQPVEAVSSISQPPRAINPAVDRDLDAICTFAIAQSPEDRYATAAALATDLRAWQQRRPLPFAGSTLLHRWGLYARRHPFNIVLAASLIAAIGVGVNLAVTSLRERERTEALQETAVMLGESLKQSLANDPPTTRLPRLAWILQDLFERQELGTPIDTGPLFDAKLTNLKLFAANEDAHELDDLYHFITQFTLAFWQLSQRDTDAALGAMQDVEAFARARLADDDRIHMHLAGLRAVAAVQHATKTPERAELAGPVDIMQQCEALLAQTDPGSPMHYMMIESLIEAFSHPLLDNPDQCQRYEEVLAAVEARRMLFPRKANPTGNEE